MKSKKRAFTKHPDACIPAAESHVFAEIDSAVTFWSIYGDYVMAYAKCAKDNDSEVCLGTIDDLEKSPDFTRTFFCTGAGHVPAQLIPAVVAKDVASWRAARKVPNKEYGEIWPIIQKAARGLNDTQKESVMGELLEEIGRKIGTLKEETDFLSACSSIVSPLVHHIPDKGHTPKKTRVLKKHGSANSEDSVGLSALSSLLPVPQSEKKKKDDQLKEIPPVIQGWMQLLMDGVFYMEATNARLKASHKAYKDPKGPKFLRNIMAGNVFSAIQERSAAWLGSSEECVASWTKKCPKVEEIRSVHGSFALLCDRFSKGDNKPTTDEVRGVLASLDVAAFNDITLLMMELTHMGKGRLEEHILKDVLQSKDRQANIIRFVQEVAAGLAICSASLVHTEGDVGANDANVGDLKSFANMIGKVFEGLLENDDIAGKREDLLNFKAFRLWLKNTIQSKLDHLKYHGDWEEVWANLEMLFKEKKSIVSQQGKWFLLDQQDVLKDATCSWTKMPLLSPEQWKFIDDTPDSERADRNAIQNPQAEEAYLDYVSRTSNGLIGSDKSTFLPDFPALGQIDTKAKWTEALGDASPHLENIREALLNLSTRKDDLSGHAAWHLVDLAEKWKDHRRSAMVSQLRFCNIQRKAGSVVVAWCLEKNHEHKTDMHISFLNGMTEYKIALEEFEDVKDLIAPAETNLKTEAQDLSEPDQNINASFVPALVSYAPALTQAKELLSALHSVAGARIACIFAPKMAELSGLHMREWEQQLMPGHPNRLRVVAGQMLSPSAISKHRRVEPAMRKLEEAIIEFEPTAQIVDASNKLYEVRHCAEDARRYIAVAAVVGALANQPCHVCMMAVLLIV